MSRLKSSIWVAAYLRRCQTEGIFGAVRKRGAEEAGAVFVKIGRSTAMRCCMRRRRRRFTTRAARSSGSSCRLATAAAGSHGRRAARQGIALRSGRLDRRNRGPGRAAFSRSGAQLTPRNFLTSGILRRRARRDARAGLHGGAGLAGAERTRWRSSSYSEGRYLARVTAMRRAAPRRQHDQRRSFAQAVIQPRQPVDVVHGRSEFGLEEHQHALEHRARHVQRLRAAQASGSPPGSLTICAATRDGRIRASPSFKREVLDVGGERRHLQRLDRALGACGRNPRRRPQRRFRQDCAGSARVRWRWRRKTCR